MALDKKDLDYLRWKLEALKDKVISEGENLATVELEWGNIMDCLELVKTAQDKYANDNSGLNLQRVERSISVEFITRTKVIGTEIYSVDDPVRHEDIAQWQQQSPHNSCRYK